MAVVKSTKKETDHTSGSKVNNMPISSSALRAVFRPASNHSSNSSSSKSDIHSPKLSDVIGFLAAFTPDADLSLDHPVVLENASAREVEIVRLLTFKYPTLQISASTTNSSESAHQKLVYRSTMPENRQSPVPLNRSKSDNHKTTQMIEDHQFRSATTADPTSSDSLTNTCQNNTTCSNEKSINSRSDLAEIQLLKGALHHSIQNGGMKQEGIFRLMRNLDRVDQLVADLLNNKNVDWASQDCHDIAGTIKAYSRKRMNNMFSKQDIEEIVKSKSANDFMQRLRKSALADSSSMLRHQQALFLSELAHAVNGEISSNRMDWGNLARVFAPNLFQHPDPAIELQLISSTIEATQLLLQWTLTSSALESNSNQ